jgi:hypothetical protein
LRALILATLLASSRQKPVARMNVISRRRVRFIQQSAIFAHGTKHFFTFWSGHLSHSDLRRQHICDN